jgi:hypothetical protein
MSLSLLRAGIPLRYVAPSQLEGLSRGAFVAQPLWQARRGVVEADGSWHWSRRDHTLRRLPRQLFALRRCGLSLEIAVFKGRRIEVTDVMLAKPFAERHRIAAAYELQLHAEPVRSLEHVNQLYEHWASRDDCRGVLLKRTQAPYPWLPRYERLTPDWVAVHQPIEVGRGQQEGSRR